ncbi:ATP-binding protein [Nocardia sp. BSTN01]|nr:ATP-binding protein [Nocardia sp. BSTN01]
MTAVDEVGYLPLESEVANLLFQLVWIHFEPASLTVASNNRFGWWHLLPHYGPKRPGNLSPASQT